MVEEEEDEQPATQAAELLRHHQRFDRMSMEKLQVMAQRGNIPPKHATCSVPVCSACHYAKATKR